MTELADLSALPSVTEQRGGDPRLVGEELLHAIEQNILRHPRTLQAEAGPSDLGTPCDRKLGYLVSGTPKINHTVGWLPTIGTAMHSLLDEFFAEENTRIGESRWLLGAAFKLAIGQVQGKDITGHGDLYDRCTAGVIDWKLVGKSTLDAAKKNRHPGEKYRIQTHGYGNGWRARGLPVDWVGVMFLPRNAISLRDAYFWHETYDPSVTDAALTRANALALAITAAGAQTILPQLNTADDFCSGCPWYSNESTDPSTACAGSQGIQRRGDQAKARATAGLIPTPDVAA